MGFKDLNLMNIALLAKQCWRMVENSEAWWVKIMKGIYFPRCAFMDAKKGAKASWAWASIIEGNEFLRKKVMWQVMSGEEINIWRDKWIHDYRLNALGNVVEGMPQKVAQLIDSRERVWKLEEIKEIINEDQVQDIMAIPICRTGGKDRMIWPLTRDGKYAVKNGYHSLKNEEVDLRKNKSSGSHKVEEIVWKKIWKLLVPNKVRNFMWKASGNWLATNYNLWRRRIRDSAMCPICESEAETVEHMLLLCEWTQLVWYGWK